MRAMTELERYLIEEVAVDHVDGIITRREALRRLGLMGVTAAAASSLIAACAETKTPTTPSGPAAATSSDAGAQAAEAITFAGPEGRTLQGRWARAGSPRGGILVIHENKGLMPHFGVVADRFAQAGYSALAIDLLSEEGGTASLGDPANATAALSKVPPDRFVADMKAGLDELTKRAPGLKLGAIGFCFGGAMTWRLIGSKDSQPPPRSTDRCRMARISRVRKPRSSPFTRSWIRASTHHKPRPGQPSKRRP